MSRAPCGVRAREAAGARDVSDASRCSGHLAMRDLLGALDARLDNVEVGDAHAIELGLHVAEGCGRIRAVLFLGVCEMVHIMGARALSRQVER
jgi:hypothetical protein